MEKNCDWLHTFLSVLITSFHVANVIHYQVFNSPLVKIDGVKLRLRLATLLDIGPGNVNVTIGRRCGQT
jgi:hypothetical protein